MVAVAHVCRAETKRLRGRGAIVCFAWDPSVALEVVVRKFGWAEAALIFDQF